MTSSLYRETPPKKKDATRVCLQLSRYLAVHFAAADWPIIDWANNSRAADTQTHLVMRTQNFGQQRAHIQSMTFQPFSQANRQTILEIGEEW